MDPTTDQIIQGLKQGNREIFEQVFKKYYTLLCFEARGYFKSTSLTEEIVCDIFTRLWQTRETLTINISVREYLVKSVHNKCIDYYRQLKKENGRTIEITDAEQSYTLMDLGESPLDYILTQELEEKIQNLIETLPPQYKKAFKLSRFKGLSYEEIADVMKISVNSVKTDIKKALAFLRQGLSDLNFMLLLYLNLF